MHKQVLQNAIAFLERTPLTGKEAIAWCEAYASLQAELATPSVPSAPSPEVES